MRSSSLRGGMRQTSKGKRIGVGITRDDTQVAIGSLAFSLSFLSILIQFPLWKKRRRDKKKGGKKERKEKKRLLTTTNEDDDDDDDAHFYL